MGCDIHMYLEHRKRGAWQAVRATDRPGEKRSDDGLLIPYWDRNYSLFGILAGVRDDTAPMIAEPKGFPDDASRLIRSEFKEWGVDAHTPSWLTAAEIMAFDWTAPMRHTGLIDWKEWNNFNDWRRQRGEHPSSWCSWTSIETIDEESAKKAVANGIKPDDPRMSRVVVRTEWSVPLWRAAGGLLNEVLPHMWRAGAHDDTRIVFWFDN